MIDFFKNRILGNTILIIGAIGTILSVLIAPSVLYGAKGSFITFMPGIFIITPLIISFFFHILPQRKKLKKYYSVAKGTELFKLYRLLISSKNLEKIADTFKVYNQELREFKLPSGGILKIIAPKTEYKKDYKIQFSFYSKDNEKWDFASLVHPYGKYLPIFRYNIIPSEFHNPEQKTNLQESINIINAIIKGQKIVENKEEIQETEKDQNIFQRIEECCFILLNENIDQQNENTVIQKISSNIKDLQYILEIKKNDHFLSIVESDILPNLEDVLNHYIDLTKIERQDLIQNEKKEIEKTLENIQNLMDQYFSKSLNPKNSDIKDKVKRLQNIALMTDFA